MRAIWKEISGQKERLAQLGFENIAELQMLQDKFSQSVKLFAFCMDSKGERVTELSGKEYGAETLYGKIGEGCFRRLFQELAGSLTEEQIVENTGISGVRAAAQIVRIEGRLAGVWVVYAVIEEEAVSIPDGVSYVVTEDELCAALDFLRMLSHKLAYLGYRKHSLESVRETLDLVLNHVGSAVYICDQQTKEALFLSRSLQKKFRKELERGLLDGLLEKAAENGKCGSGCYELYQASTGHWYDLHIHMIRWVNGRIGRMYALYDISDKKVYQKRIEQQAYTDFLTGLYNRMRCERDLAFQIDEASKSGLQGALLYLDLDDFKHINDGLGYQYGDVLLKAISHSLQRVEGLENNCYRVGGDEFIVIVTPDCFPNFHAIIDEIRDIFSKPWFLGDSDYYCTMSMGIVTFPELGSSVQDLIKKADIAMFEAKKGGKNRISYYTDKVKTSSNKRLDMEKNMRDATVDGYDEFEVYYQPIIDVNHESGADVCCGAEALIRWNSAEMGFVSPADFIPLAEYLGLINPIGNHVLHEACRECKKWNDSGYPSYKVNVNLSVVQLLQPDIVETIEAALRETGINPANLTLEVTESLAINDMERMKEILGRIRALGTRIALDDFGTGYSSLNHIRELPFDVIKIDQSFVKDLARDDYSQAFVKMVTELAAAIHVNVCVEGIETRTQYEIVREMPISMIQGYYFEKPINADAFTEKYACPRKSNQI